MADATVQQATKVCTKCGAEKPATLDNFHRHKLGKYGLNPVCKPCLLASHAERRTRPENKARMQAWRDANKDYVKAYNAEYRKDHKSTEYVAAWRAKNLDHARVKVAAYQRMRRATDPAYRMKCRLSARLNAMLKDKGGRKAEELLGFTRDQLMRHLERQFTKGMSWEAFSRGEIHIDHIVPVSAFNITSVDDPDFKVCWALTNLRPMWKVDNIKKGGKRLHLL
ncbi:MULTISPECIES: hypothetical protein [Azospirillum]|nr:MULTISPECIES: hypothetical protein [Azospirillum]YP_001686867.1 endonuclease VII [Azospirillum phage Cd]AAS83064.1 putative prophage protein [Azospirillum brasilense]MDW7555395.1 hypothetical protein [Azospirillum brasilense]MDW7595197.1 hypothetical protein [Azospirillum brasilense]MDW7630350.1 hypothetical protein [Azospirillum brasilense]MDX5949718.1 hypothetical protein [Azospirillum brasilense]